MRTQGQHHQVRVNHQQQGHSRASVIASQRQPNITLRRQVILRVPNQYTQNRLRHIITRVTSRSLENRKRQQRTSGHRQSHNMRNRRLAVLKNSSTSGGTLVHSQTALSRTLGSPVTILDLSQLQRQRRSRIYTRRDRRPHRTWYPDRNLPHSLTLLRTRSNDPPPPPTDNN